MEGGVDLLLGSWWLFVRRSLLFARELGEAFVNLAIVRSRSHSRINLRIGHRLNRIEASIDYELDVSSRQTGDTLDAPVNLDHRSLERSHRTSKTVNGVGAPGPPAPSPKFD